MVVERRYRGHPAPVSPALLSPADRRHPRSLPWRPARSFQLYSNYFLVERTKAFKSTAYQFDVDIKTIRQVEEAEQAAGGGTCHACMHAAACRQGKCRVQIGGCRHQAGLRQSGLTDAYTSHVWIGCGTALPLISADGLSAASLPRLSCLIMCVHACYSVPCYS